MFIKVNNLCPKGYPVNKWLRRKPVQDKLTLNEPRQLVFSHKSKGSWIESNLFDSFASWLNSKTKNFDVKLNDVVDVYNQKDRDDYFVRLEDGKCLRADRETNDIFLTDISSLFEKDLRTWKKSVGYKAYIEKYPDHCQSGNGILDEIGMRVTKAHPKMALEYLDYVSRKNECEHLEAIREFIDFHLCKKGEIDALEQFRFNEVEDVKEEGSNPVKRLGLMNLGPEDFAGCRMTEDGLISVVDAIKMVKGCSTKYANRLLEVWTDSTTTKIGSSKIGRYNVKVASFHQLLQILPEIVGGQEAKTLRTEQAEISTRAVVGECENCLGVKEVKEASNPVKRLGLMNLGPEDFAGCRMTEDGLISVVDAICQSKSCQRNGANDLLCKWMAKLDVTPDFMSLHKFKGQGQRKTYVTSFSRILQILPEIIGGQEAKILRKEQAEISTRAVVGDQDLIEAVQDQQTKFNPQQQSFLTQGLEFRPRKMPLSIEPFLNKDIVYCFEFTPNQELDDEKSYYNFGVTSNIEGRIKQHSQDKDFETVRLDKCFVFPDRASAGRGEWHLKQVLDTMGLRHKYNSKVECFTATDEQLVNIYDEMEKQTSIIPVVHDNSTTHIAMKLLDLVESDKFTSQEAIEFMKYV